MFMQKGTKTIVWVGGIAVAAYAVWYMIKNMHVSPRQKSIAIVAEKNYLGFEDAFLKEWSKAVKSGQPEFTYNGKVYISDGGRAKK